MYFVKIMYNEIRCKSQVEVSKVVNNIMFYRDVYVRFIGDLK